MIEDNVVIFFSSQGYIYKHIHGHYHTFTACIDDIVIRIIANRVIIKEKDLCFRVSCNLKSYGLYSFEQLERKLDELEAKIVKENTKLNEPPLS